MLATAEAVNNQQSNDPITPWCEELMELPYSKVSRMKVLGVIFDKERNFAEHFDRVLEKAKTRMSIIGKTEGYKWGLESRMIKIVGQALITSLLRYGYAIVGSGLWDKHLKQWDTCITNVLARRILGVGPPARLPVLRATAGLVAAHNMYSQHCGDLVNLALRASGSTIRTRLAEWMRTAYGVESWQTEVARLDPTREGTPHIGRLRFLDYDVTTTWLFQVLPSTPWLPSQLHVRSVFHTDAAELEAKSNLKGLTYTFADTRSWVETGVQILAASGWRPDCTLCSEINLEKALPPQEEEAKLYLVTQAWSEAPDPGEICSQGYEKWSN